MNARKPWGGAAVVGIAIFVAQTAALAQISNVVAPRSREVASLTPAVFVDTTIAKAAANFLAVLFAEPARRDAIIADSAAHESVLALIGALPEPDRTDLLGLLHTGPGPKPVLPPHRHRPPQ
jgi:hypothetical protein